VEDRDRAATLSLIGQSIQRDGVEDGNDVLLPLDAWHVGNALNAAEQENLLGDDSPLRREG
jgi:hypothetical protein